MKLGALPDNLMERVGLALGMIPPGVFEGWFGFMLARTIMVAVKLNVFEALAAGPLTSAEVAERCGTNPRGTEKLLIALVGIDCLRVKGERYGLRRSVRNWVLKDGKYSFRDQILLHFLEWRWWEHCEEYVLTGEPLRVHQTMTEEEWGIYQRGMRSGVEIPARWVARHIPLRPDAREMLDIGGSHGYFSVAVCRRFPNMRSTILDLPEAIRHAAPLLDKEGLGDRVVHRAGDALSTDLGTNAYDLVFLSAVVHHFDGATNLALMQRIDQALRPGGIVAIWEPLRQDRAGKIQQLGSLLDLFFGFFSQAGTWSAAEIAEWFRQAGLVLLQSRSPPLMSGLALHSARKPKADVPGFAE